MFRTTHEISRKWGLAHCKYIEIVVECFLLTTWACDRYGSQKFAQKRQNMIKNRDFFSFMPEEKKTEQTEIKLE